MRKFLIVFSVICILFSCLALPLFASENAETYIDDSLNEIGSELEEQLPAETKELLDELNLGELDLQLIVSLQPQQFLELFIAQLKRSWQAPLHVLGSLLGILLLSALLFPLKDTLLKQETAGIYTLAASICLCSLLMEPLLTGIRDCVESLQNSSHFLLALIPILTAILAVGGQAATATAYQLLLFTACQLTAQLTSGLAAPLLGIYTALGMVTAVFPNLGLQGLVDGLKRLLCWGVGIITTLFVAFLSLQTFVTANVDIVTQKASRFLMGSFIPIVGTILSEAFGAAQGCFSLLKSTVGTFGIIAALCMILPVLLHTILWYAVTWLGVQLSALLQVNELSALLKNANNCFSILLALLLCMLLLSVVAVTLVIFIGTGGH